LSLLKVLRLKLNPPAAVGLVSPKFTEQLLPAQLNLTLKLSIKLPPEGATVSPGKALLMVMMT